jgi:hypothetical protein
MARAIGQHYVIGGAVVEGAARVTGGAMKSMMSIAGVRR